MKNALTIVIMLVASGFATVYTWTPAGVNQKWSTTTNWDPNGAPGATDSVLFGSTATSCSLDVDFHIRDFKMRSGYTGTFFDLAHACTTATCSVGTGGTLTLTGTWYHDTTGDWKWENVGTYNVRDAKFLMAGSGRSTFYIKKPAAVLDKFALIGSNMRLALPVGTNFRTDTLTVNATDTIYLDGGLLYSNACPTGNAFLNIAGDGLISGSASGYLIVQSDESWVDGNAWQMPRLVMGGLANLTIMHADNNTASTTQVGVVQTNGALDIRTNSASGIWTYDTNDSALVWGDGKDFTWGTRFAGTFALYLGGSTVDGGNWYDSVWNTGTDNLYMECASLTISGNYITGTNTVVSHGTATITYDGTAACKLKTNNDTLYNIVVAKTANGITMQDSLKCRSLDMNDGDFSMNSQPIIVSGDIDWDSDGTFTGNGVLSITANSAIDLAGQTVSRLLLADGITATWLAGGTTTVTNYTAGDISGSAGSTVKLRSSTPGTRYNIAWPAAGITVSYVDAQDCNASSGAVTASDGTNVDSGNNLNWVFPSAATATATGPYRSTAYRGTVYSGSIYRGNVYR